MSNVPEGDVGLLRALVGNYFMYMQMREGSAGLAGMLLGRLLLDLLQRLRFSFSVDSAHVVTHFSFLLAEGEPGWEVGLSLSQGMLYV